MMEWDGMWLRGVAEGFKVEHASRLGESAALPGRCCFFASSFNRSKDGRHQTDVKTCGMGSTEIAQQPALAAICSSS